MGRGWGMWLFPVFLLAVLLVMVFMHERLIRKTETQSA